MGRDTNPIEFNRITNKIRVREGRVSLHVMTGENLERTIRTELFKYDPQPSDHSTSSTCRLHHQKQTDCGRIQPREHDHESPRQGHSCPP